MTLLSPFALLGVLLLALPVVVHLFKPRKMRQTPFSSLRWLKQTHQRLSRRIQWHQWLLFLMRAGLLLLLVLALARPLIGFGDGGQPVDRVVIVDVSRSMGYQTRDLPSPLDKARELAVSVLSKTRPGDRTAVVLAGSPPRVLNGLAADATASADSVKAVAAGFGDSSLTALLPMVQTLPGKSDRDLELVFLTDNLKRRWTQSNIKTFLKDVPRKVRVEVVDVGPGAPQNAWISQANLLSFGPDSNRILRVGVGFVGDGKTTREVRLLGIEGLDAETQTVALKPGQTAHVDFRIPAKLNLAGQVAEVRLEPADALPGDDVYLVNLAPAWGLRVLIVEPEATGTDGRGVGLHLQLSAEALIETNKQVLHVETRPAAQVGADHVQKADVIFLAGVPELSDTAAEALEAQVRAGAGLVIFLGPHVKPAFYNRVLHKPLQPGDGLLPLALKAAPDLVMQQGNPGLLTGIRWSHPLLAPLHDPVFGDLTLARFHTYGALVGTPGKDDVILARIDDDVPALIEHPLGKGRVLLVNTTANGDWGDLSVKKSFVPLFDRMLSYLGNGGLKREFTAGEIAVVPLPKGQDADMITVITPGGVKLQPGLRMQRGQAVLQLDELEEIGVYRVERDGKLLFPLVVNAGRGDSPLGTMDAKDLAEWWAPASFEMLSPETMAERLQTASSYRMLWPALVFLGGLLLLGETIYVYRLCPRVNDVVAESVVPQRGLLRPVGK